MTYRQYLENCDDEFERTVIVANLARKHPNYDSYSPKRKKEVVKELLDEEMPQAVMIQNGNNNYQANNVGTMNITL